MDNPSWTRDRGNCRTKEHLAFDTEKYAREVVEEYDLDLDIDAIDFEASGKLTRSHGVFSRNGNGEQVIRISWKSYKNHGWEETKTTIRHELAHAEQYFTFGYTGHGAGFRRLAERLDTHVSCDSPASEPKYIVACQDCEVEYLRFRKSKLVKNPEYYSCGECNGTLERRK